MAHQASTLKAATIARAHTYLAFTAFLTALALGCLFHYKKIVKNGVAGYPEEWFPSVSATIGDWYPERSIFHILIALNSGPRFALVFLQYYIQRTTSSTLSSVVLISGLVRTLSCGGWVFITSNDDHDAHDILMITYIICNLPWMFGGIACSRSRLARSRRTLYASVFFVTLLPLVYYFVQHKVHRIPGAYTKYAFFEWNLIFMDVLFDGVSEIEFREAGLELMVAVPGAVKLALVAEKPSETVADDKILRAEKSDVQPKKNESSTPSSSPKLDLKADFWKQANGFLLRNRPIISFASDLYLNYIFWSIFTSLIPSLFYFSVWELGIGGAELALTAILSPIFLGIGPLGKWAATRGGRVTFHCLSLLGLVAYVVPKAIHRLILVTIANVFLCIGAVTDWSGLSSANVYYQNTMLSLGLFMSSVSKLVNRGNNLIWPMVDESSGGWNKTAILLALGAIYEYYYRPPVGDITKANDGENSKSPPAEISHRNSSLLSALPLGSLLFSLHCFLTDSSTIIAWSWTGYPITGPVPHVHGSVTLLVQALGIAATLVVPAEYLRHPIWFIVGASSCSMMYAYKDWLGYFGGLGFAFFLTSLIPQIMIDASRTTAVAKTYTTAFLVTIILYLANVWTVAYAFVPGGKYLRERSDLVLQAELLLLLPAFTLPSTNHNLSSVTASKLNAKLKSFTGITTILLCMSALGASLYRVPSRNPQPFRPGPRIIRAGIWTVHFGMDNTGRDSQRGMLNLIRDMELDIVGLLETDLHRIAFGNRDLTRVLVEEMGYYVDLGPGPNQHTWGAVLLSMYPIINSTHHLLPSPNGELAPAISAWLDMWGTEVQVIVAHNGQEEDPLDRELQSTELARIMADAYPHPTLFLGYVVTLPHADRPNPYEIMVKDGKVHDIEDEDWDRWCEYIFYRGLYRTSYLRMSRGRITDTELQVGQFVLPKYGHTVGNDSREARYLRKNKESLPEAHWFPMAYYGNEFEGGVNGHFYHVFGTPLYYGLPEDALL